MPGGRIKPVYFSESLGTQQAKAAAEAARIEAEIARQKAAEAQDALRREELRQAQAQAVREQELFEKKKRDDDLLHTRLESKLAESNAKNTETLNDDAESDVHESQMRMLLTEKAEREANLLVNDAVSTSTNVLPELDTDVIEEEMKALQVRIQNVLDADIATATA